MEYGRKRPAYIDYLLMFVGTGIMAFAINTVYEPSSLVTGGFTGAAIVIKEYTKGIIEGGVPIWLTNIILNIPAFMLAARIKGFRFLKRTLFATVWLSIWLYVIPVYKVGIGDLVLSAVFGGGLSGIGIGLVFSANATTGGTDMVAAVIQHKLKHYSIVQILQVIDALVVVIGAYTFGLTAALYAIIAIVVTAYLSDYLIEGGKFAKVAFIITDHSEAVRDVVFEELGRGLTGWNAKGMYSEQHRNVLFCVVSKKEIVTLKEAIGKIDEKAFVVVTDAREVLGEGFLERKD